MIKKTFETIDGIKCPVCGEMTAEYIDSDIRDDVRLNEYAECDCPCCGACFTVEAVKMYVSSTEVE